MSELALRLIAKNKKTRAPFLDLGNCGLTEVPEAIEELVWLEDLSFAKDHWDGGEKQESKNTGPANNIAHFPATFTRLQSLKTLRLAGNKKNRFSLHDLSPLSGLVNLQTLDVSQTQVSDLSPLAGLANLQTLDAPETEVSDLSPLTGLANLRQLDVSRTKVSDLSPLTGLVNLWTLQAGGNRISDLTPLVRLVNLEMLSIASTEVSDLSPLAGLLMLRMVFAWSSQVYDLSPLAGLLKLQRLDVANTHVSDLIPLADLVNLQKLDVSNTQVSDLSPVLPLVKKGHIVEYQQSPSKKDHYICVKGCPLINPPIEIVEQGNEAILRFFAEKQRSNTIKVREAKLLLVGQGKAGKTTLKKKLQDPNAEMPEPGDTTRGIEMALPDFVG